MQRARLRKLEPASGLMYEEDILLPQETGSEVAGL